VYFRHAHCGACGDGMVYGGKATAWFTVDMPHRLNYLAVISMPPPSQCGVHASHLIFSQSVWMGLHGLDSHPPPHRTHQGSDRDAEAEEESEGE
jgi:hypothetical protein